MTSDQRLDTLVWVSCVLLHVSRRPEICHDRIVSMFNVRYDFPEVELDRSMIAKPYSSAEDELLEFLAMASDSYPMHKVICVEAIELENKHETSAAYSPSVFGCSSPSSFTSAFLGVKNPQIKTLVARKGWLTADIIVVMNLRYLIRQNCYSVYLVVEDAEKGSLVLTSHTKPNFSSYGQLYALLLIIDVLLLTLNCLSSLELIQWMTFPKFQDVKSWAEQIEAKQKRRRDAKKRMVMHLLPHRWRRSSRLIAPASAEPGDSASSASASVERATAILSRRRRRRLLTSTVESMSGAWVNEEEHLYSFFSRSLYREPRIAMITVTTQLMSWLLVLPNSVVWTWSDSIHEKAQAYLSSIRCWVLILILCNTLWSCVTRVSERYAYEVTKRTYLTSIDIISVGAIVSFWQRHVIFSMCETKWNLEHQRINDVMSFQGEYIAHGNTFSLALDSREITPWTVLAVLYGPLLRILGHSLLLIALLLATKAGYLESKRFRNAKYKQLCRQVSMFFKRISIKVPLSGPKTGISVMPVRSDIPPDAYEDSDDDDMQHNDLRVALSQPYKRLPLEEWLDQPIRATSLIRNGLYMETVLENTRFIRPGCYLDFGIIVKHGVIHSRFGFSDPWKPKMTVEEYMAHVEHRTQRSTGSSPNSSVSALNTQLDVSAHIEAVQRLSMDA